MRGRPQYWPGRQSAGRAFSWLGLALIRPLGNGHNMTSWGVGERGVARMYGCAPLFYFAAIVSGVAPAGGVGGDENRGH